MATDPVCDMAVATGSPHNWEIDGNTWWFFSAHCRDEFAADPHRFLHHDVQA